MSSAPSCAAPTASSSGCGQRHCHAAVFVANAEQTLSKQELMQTVWPNVHVGEDSLFQCIREIRAALGDRPPPI